MSGQQALVAAPRCWAHLCQQIPSCLELTRTLCLVLLGQGIPRTVSLLASAKTSWHGSPSLAVIHLLSCPCPSAGVDRRTGPMSELIPSSAPSMNTST